jgi:hypothetical protein
MQKRVKFGTAILLEESPFAIYFLSYFGFQEDMGKDQKTYVIFPEDKVYLYYFYRP